MGTCSGIFLLNTFFPPRPTDISLHYYLLYQIWFFSTGIFDGYLPEWGVMRFMCPSATSTIISGYSAPYSAGVATKASVTRFAHIVPGIPDTILSLRSTYWWCLIEGLLNPWNFTNINAQAALAERNVDIREWWAASSSSQSKNSMPKVLVAFGEDDPLLKEFKEVLVLTFPSKTLVRCPNGSWIPHAGHYPMEEKPYVIADLLCNFVIDSSSL